ncbi:hypothetical protein CC78DRAFT_323597 [Lojkania enalia]|uniref:Protein kinase domain-containing protein n=1 Tax=Lojkania enalia TaxID=147567 RepID=A0A9P4K5K6_9PLEO|nr:hypothetical protein CC78DRAFT_323597 [Didymosphaeria enalia]
MSPLLSSYNPLLSKQIEGIKYPQSLTYFIYHCIAMMSTFTLDRCVPSSILEYYLAVERDRVVVAEEKRSPTPSQKEEEKNIGPDEGFIKYYLPKREISEPEASLPSLSALRSKLIVVKVFPSGCMQSIHSIPNHLEILKRIRDAQLDWMSDFEERHSMPRIHRIHIAGLTELDRTWYSMSFVHGQPLEHLLHGLRGEALAPSLICHIFASLFHAIDFLRKVPPTGLMHGAITAKDVLLQPGKDARALPKVMLVNFDHTHNLDEESKGTEFHNVRKILDRLMSSNTGSNCQILSKMPEPWSEQLSHTEVEKMNELYGFMYYERWTDLPRLKRATVDDLWALFKNTIELIVCRHGELSKGMPEYFRTEIERVVVSDAELRSAAHQLR